jgi:hypothetical protein
MAKRDVQKKRKKRVSYPTLQEHLVSRRRFLELAGGCLAASTMWAACGRGIGASNPDGPDASTPDGSVDAEADGEVEIGGAVEQPQYHTLRLPAEGELISYLVPDGRCVFYVNVATYSGAAFNALMENRQQANDVCRSTISDFSYETLDGTGGVSQAEDDLYDSLLVLLSDLVAEQDATLEAVTFHIVELDPDVGLDGDPPQPSYP